MPCKNCGKPNGFMRGYCVPCYYQIEVLDKCINKFCDHCERPYVGYPEQEKCPKCVAKENPDLERYLSVIV